jgi:beta-lactamase superfamily II metal-dependent hydrolase
MNKVIDLEIKIFQVFCGDCISIIYTDEEANEKKSIIIDAGYAKTYHTTLKQEIAKLEEADLFVITHMDDDHIGGMTSFINEYPILPIKEFWFNYCPIDSDISTQMTNKISVGQALKLRDYLSKNAIISPTILQGFECQIGLANLKVLSPNKRSYEKYVKLFPTDETENEFLNKISARENDYSASVESFRDIPFVEDSSIPNGGSIAFLFQLLNFKMLFLADAHPSVIVEGLTNLGFSKDNKISVNYVKLSHHGSSFNISEALIQMIDCKNYIISTDGSKHQLPNKKTLSKILLNQTTNDVNFIFNYGNHITRNIFTLEEQNQFGFELTYPSDGENYYSIKQSLHYDT